MERWFYNGTLMPDGTRISVLAASEFEAEGFLKMGFEELNAQVGRKVISARQQTRRVKKRGPL